MRTAANRSTGLLLLRNSWRTVTAGVSSLHRQHGHIATHGEVALLAFRYSTVSAVAFQQGLSINDAIKLPCLITLFQSSA